MRETKMNGADFEIEDCCDTCKHSIKSYKQEPCKSCKIIVTGYEPEESLYPVDNK